MLPGKVTGTFQTQGPAVTGNHRFPEPAFEGYNLAPLLVLLPDLPRYEEFSQVLPLPWTRPSLSHSDGLGSF